MRATIVDWRAEHTIEGEFWLPAAPERRVAGRIETKGGHFPVLRTFDRLLLDSERADSVYGATAGGSISLLGCKLFSSEVPLLRENFIRQTIGCDYVLFDRHAIPASVGRRFLFRYTNTHRIGGGELWRLMPEVKENENEYSVTFRFVTSEHIARARANSMSVDIYVDASVSPSYGAAGSRFLVTPEVDVIVEFDSTASTDEIRQIRTDLGLFWSLLTGTRSEVVGALVSAQGRTPGLPSADRDDDEFSSALLGPCGGDAEDRACLGDLLYDLSRGVCKGQLGSVLGSWLAQRDSLRTAGQLLVDTWNQKVGWESRLGIVAQALEALHRVSSHRKTFIAEDEYAKLEAALASQIPVLTTDVDLRRALAKRLEFGNQVSLRRRTQDLVRVLPVALRSLFGSKWREGVEFMIRTRNAMIHRDPANPLPPYHELVKVTGLFCITIHVALLRLIGVPEDPIVQRLPTQELYQESLARAR